MNAVDTLGDDRQNSGGEAIARGEEVPQTMTANSIAFHDIQRLREYDVLDSSGRWCEGMVTKINQQERSVFVTYLYWDTKFDDWIDDVEQRIAPLHTHTYREGGVLKVGQRIEVLDNRQIWLEAFVIEESPTWVKVHYKNYHSKFDEIIQRSDAPARVRPYGRHKHLPDKAVLRGPKKFLPRSVHQAIADREQRPTPGRPLSAQGKGPAALKTPGGSRAVTGPGGQIVTYNAASQNQHESAGVETVPRHSANQVDGEEIVDDRTRRITNLSDQYQRYSDALNKQNLAVVPVQGDGNCLFRAVAHQVYGNENYHTIVRQKCLDYMEVEADFFCQFVEGGKEMFPFYLRAKRMDACWGDDPEIEALCELYDRRAEIWAFDATVGARKLRTFHETTASYYDRSGGGGGSSSSGGGVGRALTPPRSATGQRSAQSPRAEGPVIRLSYYGGGHYDSIVTPYHAETVLKLPVGEVEDRRIASAMRRQTERTAAAGRAIDDRTIRGEGLSEQEVQEQAALEQALQLSRQGYLNAGNEDLESCLLMSLQQYAQDSGQHAIAAHIPLRKESVDAISGNINHGAEVEREFKDCAGEPNLLSMQENQLRAAQEESEREYYESAVISSLKAEGKFDDSALTEQELLDLVAKQSAREEEERERQLLESTLRESAALSGAQYGVSTAAPSSQPKAGGVDMAADSKSSALYAAAKSSGSGGGSGGGSSGETQRVRDDKDVIHLADLKENDALDYALRQSLAEYCGGNNSQPADAKGSADYPDYGVQTEEEMLNFALEASLQGYTSSNYADYKTSFSAPPVAAIAAGAGGSGGGNGEGKGGNGHSSSDAGAASASHVAQAGDSHTSYSQSGIHEGRSHAVNLGAAYGGMGAGDAYFGNDLEAEDMDEDLMRAIAESLKK